MTPSANSLRDESAPAPATPVIGLTGAPAAGKSEAAAAFAAAGCTVVDADALGHLVLARPETCAGVELVFGAELRAADGRLDRARLAELVFDDPAALRRLEAIVHPLVRAEIVRRVEEARAAEARAVVLDAALLFETGLWAACDLTVCVTASREARAARARAARDWDDAELSRREARQLPPEEKASRADRVLPNDGDVAALRARVLHLLADVAPAAASQPAR